MSDANAGWKPRSNPWLVAVIVTLGAFMEVLDTTIVNVSLPHIAGSLSVSSDDSTWTLTTYLVANGIVLTISGALSRRLGRKSYFLICLGGFTATSFACGTTQAFWQILVFRTLQGFFGGGLQPTQQAIILDHFPPEKRQQAFSLTAIAIIIAPVVGPVVGGWLTDTYSWHWIFLINVPIGILTFFGVLQFVEDSPLIEHEKKTAPPFDYLGVVFIALALGCLEIAVDRGEDYDWLGSSFERVMFTLSACGFVFGIAYLLYTRNPVVNLRVFKDRNLALGSLQIAIMGFVLYASAVLIPQFAQQQLAYTATWAGLVLAPGAIVLTMLIPVAGRIMNVVPTKYVIAGGGLALGVALIYSSNLVPNLDFRHLVLFRAAQTAALALLFVPISTLAYATIPAELNGDAAALFTMARNVAGGIGISISTALVTEHLQIRQAHLVHALSPTNQPYNVLLQQVQQALVDAGQSVAQAAQAAPGQVFQMLQQQTAVLAYNDVFILTAIMSFVMIPTALMMSGVKGKSGGGVPLTMRTAASLLLALALTACSVGPDFKPPQPPAIAKWNDRSANQRRSYVSTQTNPDPKWWNGFDDPTMTTVIDQSIGGNLDLQQAVLRVVEAEQGEVSARAAGLPSVNGTGSYVRDQLGVRGLLLSQGIYGQIDGLSGGSAIAGALNGFSQPVNLYQYGLSSSWELDLFGRVRRSVEQAKATAEAQLDATSDALVMLEGQVAQAYVQLRGAQALVATQQENIRTSQESLNLTGQRQAQGLATDLDVEQARTQLATTESQLPGYQKQAQQALNRLSVLSGQPPGALDAMLGPSAPLPKVPAVVNIGVPSTLTRRRPDIREAEARLHAATANVGVATASFYPDISLTGSFGLRALDASYLTNWASAFYSFGPSISLPIFQGGRLTAGLRMARAQEAEATLAYRSTVLNALREVEDALVAYRTDRIARDKLAVAVRSGRMALYLARDRYSHGLADFIQVLDAERTLIGSRQQLVQADLMLTNDVVALYDALGGGWQEDTATSKPPAVNKAPPLTPAALDSAAAAVPRPSAAAPRQ